MIEAVQDYFREMAETHPKWNFIFFYEPNQWERVLSGLWVTIELSIICVILSVIIGLVGAWLQGSPNKLLRYLVQGYIQFFPQYPAADPAVVLLFCPRPVHPLGHRR